MNYERIRRRGLNKVSCEIMLMCLGRNVRKLFTLIESNNIKSNYWEKSSDLKKENFSFPKQKKCQEKSCMKLFHFMTAPF